MLETTIRTFPPGITRQMLLRLLEEAQSRESLLQGILQRFEQCYEGSLEALEARLAQGEGNEHPDWEDSIEWRNAVESLHRNEIMRDLLEWLLRLTAPSSAS